jgi:2,3-bisphosphoglycerate-dependent phosphoglycerate mutase
LILLRHESEWNALNLFTGWVDVDLTDKGRAEAAPGGELIKELDRQPDVLYTSLLRRAITTANLALDACRPALDPGDRSWRLNERHYGALQGLDKAETKAKYGEEQFMAWRRSYDTPPPPIEEGSKYSQDADPRYADIGGGPLTECLADVVARFVPYFEGTIVPDLQAGKTVLIAAHGNSLRALVKVPRRDERRRGGRPEHPDRHPAALRPRRRAEAEDPGGTTSIRRPRPPVRRRWPVRAQSSDFGDISANIRVTQVNHSQIPAFRV